MTIKYKTAQEIFTLLTQDEVTSHYGNMYFDYLGIRVLIEDKSPVGYLLQSWLRKWLESKNIFYRDPPNSQEFPDFFLQEGDKNGLFEFKTFDLDASANFDIANFEAYCSSLKTKAFRLDADYLIFGYTLRNCKLKVKKIWLKKIWEISCPSKAYPVKVQQKRNMIYNLRPATWYSARSQFKIFNSKENFVLALSETLLQYKKTSKHSVKWLDEVSENYKSHTGNDLL